MQQIKSCMICSNQRPLFDGQTLEMCASGSWRTVAAMNGIANAMIQCLTSSKVTSSEPRRCVSSTLACAVSPQPAWPTMGHLFFNHPHALYISQTMTHCLLFVFLFALFSCCLEQSLAVLIFVVVVHRNLYFFMCCQPCLKDFGDCLEWGSKTWVDQPAWSFW